MKHLYAWSVAYFGTRQAENYIQGLLRRIEILRENPELGTRMEASESGIRKLIYRTHIVFYRIQPTKIRIIRVMDAMRGIRIQT